MPRLKSGRCKTIALPLKRWQTLPLRIKLHCWTFLVCSQLSLPSQDSTDLPRQLQGKTVKGKEQFCCFAEPDAAWPGSLTAWQPDTDAVAVSRPAIARLQRKLTASYGASSRSLTRSLTDMFPTGPLNRDLDRLDRFGLRWNVMFLGRQSVKECLTMNWWGQIAMSCILLHYVAYMFFEMNSKWIQNGSDMKR